MGLFIAVSFGSTASIGGSLTTDPATAVSDEDQKRVRRDAPRLRTTYGGSLSGGGRDERDWLNDDIAFFVPVNLRADRRIAIQRRQGRTLLTEPASMAPADQAAPATEASPRQQCGARPRVCRRGHLSAAAGCTAVVPCLDHPSLNSPQTGP